MEPDPEGAPAARPAPARPTYWLTRFLILRLLGLVYLIGFLILANQGPALIGERGLLPARLYLEGLEARFGSRWEAFLQVPSLFWWTGAGDGALAGFAWVGAALAALVVAGLANSLMMAALWALYLSFVRVGQDWYGFGWEIQLLETGFLAIFLCPLLDARPFPRRAPPALVVGLFRWLTFRIMLGAGLIKIRGDACWRDLTCLVHHYETQPIPNPLSRAFHFMPLWFHQAGVLYNHLVELAAPWLAFWPRAGRHAAGLLMLSLQVILILSGNLSFLNWLTIVPILACFDDRLLARVLPVALARRAMRAQAEAVPSRAQAGAAAALALLVAILSVNPIANLASGRQVMNTSFDRLSLVNTYGAFGSVGERRAQLVFEATRDAVLDERTTWVPFELKCQPGDPMRRPCVVSPYHYRLDWQIWFAAMGSPDQYTWTLHLVWKLLHDDPGALGLMAGDPIPEAAPRFVRVRLYEYAFAPAGDPSGAWWRRTLLGEWLPPLSADDPRLRRYLAAPGWIDASSPEPGR